MAKWWIGCSGFHYKDWKEVFYPANIPQTRWFEYYCMHFNSIELNVTFYRFPRVEALQKWYSRSPEEFRFSVKAPRLITHYKLFKESQRMLGDFYASIYEGLNDKLGCVLFQLPSTAKYSDEMLQRIIGNVDPSFDNVIEFRDPGWWNEKVYRQLKKHSISFCGISHPQLPHTVIKNTPVLYYRFHGVPQLYKSEYDVDFIKEIAGDISATRGIKDSYIYFNNTWGTGALNNGKQMQKLILSKF